MKMQLNNTKLKALAYSVALMALAHTGMASANIHIKFHHDLPEDSAQHLAAERFRDIVAERSDGEITVQLFPNNTLGDDVEVTQQMQMGAVEAAIIPTAKLSGFVPAMQIVDLPFLFPSPEVAHTVLDGQAGDDLLATVEQVGLKGVTFWESGFKQFTCDQPVNGPEDFAGQKVRVMQSPIIMEQFKAMGANPVPIAFGETYNALQQRIVDCQENPLVSITQMKFYEVQSDVVISNHAYLGYAFLFSQRWFDGLSPENQALLTDVARETTTFQREETARREAGYLATIEASGTAISTLDDAQLSAFREATASVHEAFASDIGTDLMGEFEQSIANAE
ncbi:TRAP transporter substrate-binding protein [Vreelandella populi]|uniref:TRAP transporter substrate-binding protein n=1 Tax=Vreelandella populi TaxID=2498858 RepID=A0A433LCN3_9GAMM|nr:TRAP transporter substrate-binding protein [Halomonas populi]RUR46452.1 TRAP transporter substrate-binding protein [Halomonas populi]